MILKLFSGDKYTILDSGFKYSPFVCIIYKRNYKFVIVWGILEGRIHLAHLELGSIPGCPKSHNTFDFDFQMLELQTCTSIPSINSVLSISEI